MTPSHNYIIEPISRTYQYRKVMKPMLERKRRARINRCLDELRELMASEVKSDDQSLARLEKADILELTVRHLQNLKQKNSLYVNNAVQTENASSTTTYDYRFWDGFRCCVNEVTRFLYRFDQKAAINFLHHIKPHLPKNSLNKNATNVDELIRPTRFENHNKSVSQQSSHVLLAHKQFPHVPVAQPPCYPNVNNLLSYRHRPQMQNTRILNSNNIPTIVIDDCTENQALESRLLDNHSSNSNDDDSSGVWRPW